MAEWSKAPDSRHALHCINAQVFWSTYVGVGSNPTPDKVFFFISFVLYYHAVLIFAVGITCVRACPILQFYFNFTYKCVMSYLVLLISDGNNYVMVWSLLGKTETTKLLIRQIVQQCSRTADDSGTNLHDALIEINPLMEAFGNAKTTMNENSSRFGKYIELLFTDDGQISGGTETVYLLWIDCLG